MASFKETVKMLGRAVKDQGKGRFNFNPKRKPKPKKGTDAEKRKRRLEEGFPTSDGRTSKKAPKTKRGKQFHDKK